MSAVHKIIEPKPNNTYWKNIPSIRQSKSPSYSNTAKVHNELLHSIELEHLGRVSNPPDDVRLKRELESILSECSENDWDGYGALPIDLKSVRWASKFIAHLPDYISYPELSPEPTGELTMLWDKRGYYIIIGINSEGHISYGGTSPTGHIYGDSQLNDDATKIPVEITELLELVDGRS